MYLPLPHLVAFWVAWPLVWGGSIYLVTEYDWHGIFALIALIAFVSPVLLGLVLDIRSAGISMLLCFAAVWGSVSVEGPPDGGLSVLLYGLAFVYFWAAVISTVCAVIGDYEDARQERNEFYARANRVTREMEQRGH